MQIDFAAREMTLKLVYYGPALSGKTTNLQSLHHLSHEENRGHMMTLDTRDDRTLFFDLLPLTFQSERSFAVRLKLFTVPGQVIHTSTRKLVLAGADGVAFIADSQIAETQNNATAFRDLKANLEAHGVELRSMPLVIQFNKRDLPDIRSDEELRAQARRGKEPVFTAIAKDHVGTLATFVGLLYITWRSLQRQHDLAGKFGIRRDDFLRDMVARFGGTSLEELLGSALTSDAGSLYQPEDA